MGEKVISALLHTSTAPRFLFLSPGQNIVELIGKGPGKVDFDHKRLIEEGATVSVVDGEHKVWGGRKGWSPFLAEEVGEPPKRPYPIGQVRSMPEHPLPSSDVRVELWCGCGTHNEEVAESGRQAERSC